MKTYLAVFLIAAFSAAVITPLLRRWCERYRFVDRSTDHRRIHLKAVPRLGGVAIFIAVVLSLVPLIFIRNLVIQNLRSELGAIISVVVCGLLVLLLGVYDDLRGAKAPLKLLALSAIAVIFFGLGGRIEGLSIPFVGQVVVQPLIGFALTLVWIVGITNAFNLIDGVDGLAAGSALFSTLVLLITSLIHGNARVTVVALALGGALAGFLRYNFNPASIFLGDSGSLFVGFALAALSIEGAQKASTAVAVAIPILAFGLPVVDTSVTIARRLLSGHSIFRGDREHIHHMLLARGWSQRQVVLALYAVSAGFGLAAMLFVNTNSAVPAVVLVVIGVAIVLALGNLRYHEVDELRASVKRNLSDRRARAINNLRIRRACQSLASAKRLDQFFEAVVEVVEGGNFVSAAAELSCQGHPRTNARAIELAQQSSTTAELLMAEGCVRWEWQRQTSLRAEIADVWTIRLPISRDDSTLGYVDLNRPLDGAPLLFDINYLTSAFQPALINAAERIFDHAEQTLPQQRAASAH
ncbi:MAG TPA: MraY family glycosyltransferase [Pyrinomonadaceae bacterium]|nr:MraY family glycosyltransferase [Pyrinomonadaceae bacterium]